MALDNAIVLRNLKENFANTTEKINELNSKLNDLTISRAKFAGAIEVLEQIERSKDANPNEKAGIRDEERVKNIDEELDVITKDGVTYKAVSEKKS